MKDPAIKLFGKEIAVAKIGCDPVFSSENFAIDEKDELENDKDSEQDKSPPPIEEDETLYDPEDNPQTPPNLEENASETTLDTKNDQNMAESDEKPLKKPDKILPCPRCNSMDTKFCYYNNYNVNQPRHFCKGCQRYWTAGGTTRNVPVGAGRRKNKNSASHYRHITVSDATTQYTNANILSFGSNTLKNGPIFQNKILKAEKEYGSDCSSGSSVISSSNPVIPCLQGFPTWPYPAIPTPGFCPPGYPISVYPIPYWNCGFPLITPPCGINQNFPNNSPTLPLGKHSRNGELLNPINIDSKELKEPRTILIPKILRIDDPDEAAKSSIWATLGINNDLVNRKSIFKAFEPRGEGKKIFVPETPESMRANPAAMSRSANFQETA